MYNTNLGHFTHANYNFMYNYSQYILNDIQCSTTRTAVFLYIAGLHHVNADSWLMTSISTGYCVIISMYVH